MRGFLTERQWKIALTIFGLLFGTVLVLLFAQRKPLTSDAQSYMQAVLNGDGEALYRLSYDMERKLLRLTPEKLTRFLREILVPEMRGMKVVSMKPWADQADAREACVEVRLEGPPSRSHVMTFCVYRSEQGGRAMVSGLVFDAWMLRYVVNKGKPMNWKARYEAAILGITADRERLLAIGLPGYVPVPQPGAPAPTLRTWGAVLASSRQRLKNYAQTGSFLVPR